MRERFLLVASFADSVVSFRGDLIRDLQQRGLGVHVAVPGVARLGKSAGISDEHGIVWHDIPLRRASKNPFADLFLVARLYKLMRAVRPGGVLSYTAKPIIFGLIAARLAGVANRSALISGLGFAFTGRAGALQLILRALYRLALDRAQTVFFQNPDDKELFEGLGVLRGAARVTVVRGSGVNLAEYDVVSFPEGAIRFLMIGRLLGDKGVREYVDAAREIRARFPDATFSLVGWIDENPDAIMPDELDRWIAEGVVEFIGRIDDVRPEIGRCHVYVLPSYREGTPRTVLEAMSMGRPIITTNAPGCRETVIDGENGFLVPVRSVDPLVAAMRRFIESPELVKSMGVRSREIAEDRFDVRKVNAAMLKEMGFV